MDLLTVIEASAVLALKEQRLKENGPGHEALAKLDPKSILVLIDRLRGLAKVAQEYVDSTASSSLSDYKDRLKAAIGTAIPEQSTATLLAAATIAHKEAEKQRGYRDFNNGSPASASHDVGMGVALTIEAKILDLAKGDLTRQDLQKYLTEAMILLQPGS